MTKIDIVEALKSKFEGLGNSIEIPLLKKGKSFTATLRADGIEVTNLHNQKLMERKAFEEAMSLIEAALTKEFLREMR